MRQHAWRLRRRRGCRCRLGAAPAGRNPARGGARRRKLDGRARPEIKVSALGVLRPPTAHDRHRGVVKGAVRERGRRRPLDGACIPGVHDTRRPASSLRVVEDRLLAHALRELRERIGVGDVAGVAALRRGSGHRRGPLPGALPRCSKVVARRERGGRLESERCRLTLALRQEPTDGLLSLRDCLELALQRRKVPLRAGRGHWAGARNLRKRDLVVLALVIVPDLTAYDVVPQRKEQRLLLNPRKHVAQPNREREPVEHAARDRVEILCSHFARRLPPVHSEADGDPLLERDVPHARAAVQARPVLRQRHVFERKIRLCARHRRLVRQLHRQHLLLLSWFRPIDRTREVALRAARIRGRPFPRDRKRLLLRQKQLDALQPSIKVHRLGAHGRARLASRRCKPLADDNGEVTTDDRPTRLERRLERLARLLPCDLGCSRLWRGHCPIPCALRADVGRERDRGRGLAQRKGLV